MIRRYIWICVSVVCLGMAATACGKADAADVTADVPAAAVTTAAAPIAAVTEEAATETADTGAGTLAPGTADTGTETAALESNEMEGTAPGREEEETVEFDGEYYRKSELSEETLKWLERYQAMPEEMQMALNAVPHEFVRTLNQGDMAVETDAAAKMEPDILLTSAPEITLSDALSSACNYFVLQSGNYEWSVMENGEPLRMVACGAHPLDDGMGKAERLKLPRYQRMDMDEVMYSLGCVVLPDRLTLVMWDVSDLGNVEAQAEETITYEGDTLINLKPGKVYEITAEWTEEQLEKRGFSGTASYPLITE